jgi:hypothetical protein
MQRKTSGEFAEPGRKQQPMTTELAKTRPDKRSRVTGRLKAALDLMIWPDEMGRTQDYYEAARTVNIAIRSMRKSLERPAVRMYLRTEAEVFRATLNAKSLSRLAELGWQNTNMNAAVNAVKAIRGEDDEARSTIPTSPHVTIRIVNVAPAPPVTTIEHVRPIAEPEPRDPYKPQVEYDAQGHRIPVFDPFRDR